MSKKIFFFFSLIYSFSAVAQRQDSCSGKPEERFRVLFIVDASFSMDRKWGKEPLWDVSRKTVEEFAYFLQKNYNVEMGLRIYGHQSPLSDNDCKDSKLEVPIELNTAYQISQKLKNIKYRGTTPLTYSLEKAAEDLGCNSKKNIIILITDGYETCNLNPCAVAEKLLDYRISIKPLILGLNIDYKDVEHLKCIGDFYNVKNKEEYKRDLYNSFINIANKKSFSLFLKNGTDSKSESNVAFSVFNSKNRALIGTFYHHINEKGLPDTITIGNYDTVDIKVHSIPPIYLLDHPLKKYIHNTIKIDFPIGKLIVAWDSIKSNIHFPDPELIVYKDGVLIDRSEISYQNTLIEGNYSLFTTTNPTQLIENVHINSKKTTKIFLPNAGYLTINKSYAIHGDLYILNKNGLEKIITLNPNKTKEIFTIQPGTYKIVYKSMKAISIHGTFEKIFEIKSFGEITINL